MTVLLTFPVTWSMGQKLRFTNGSLIGQKTQPIRQNGFVEQQFELLTIYPDLLAKKKSLVNRSEQIHDDRMKASMITMLCFKTSKFENPLCPLAMKIVNKIILTSEESVDPLMNSKITGLSLATKIKTLTSKISVIICKSSRDHVDQGCGCHDN